MRPNEIMRSDVVTIGPDETASAAGSLMKRERIAHLVVTEDGRKLGKFPIERVSVRVEDVNGPRGGIDKGPQAAMDRALSRVERAVR